MTTMDVLKYLRRLGVEHLAGQEPSADHLTALHRAHAERVPYECLWIWIGQRTTVDAAESADRVLRGRGGYCYHLNGAFALLLESLGYRVTRHVGGVQSQDHPAGATGNHLVLTVSGLPSAAAPDGHWLADLGMGDGLHDPLPLVTGEFRQGPFRYALRPSEAEPGGWRFDHDPRGSFPGMDFRAEPAAMADFAERHEFLSTSPESGFVRVATAARRDADGADILRGLTLTRVAAETTTTTLDGRAAYLAALADVFGLTYRQAEQDLLWRRVSAAHERWTS